MDQLLAVTLSHTHTHARTEKQLQDHMPSSMQVVGNYHHASHGAYPLCMIICVNVCITHAHWYASWWCWLQAHFSKFTGRDAAMSKSLNSDYLSQLYIRADTKSMDKDLVREEVATSGLPEEAQALVVFKRG